MPSMLKSKPVTVSNRASPCLARAQPAPMHSLWAKKVASRRDLVVVSSAALSSAVKKESWNITMHTTAPSSPAIALPTLITKEQVQALESTLDQGLSMAALRRFNTNLRNLPSEQWESLLVPVFVELCYNLESFNPAFTSCLLMVQRTLGVSDYVRRDVALKNLIQPLAGEYGMHNDQPQLKTHRELFADFFSSLFDFPLEQLIVEQKGVKPPAADRMWKAMSRDIMTAGGKESSYDVIQQASYALGYNLAIEYLADYEKTWMLDSFRSLDGRLFKPAGRSVDWVFLEVHAEGEAEHAAIGHNAVINFVPEEHTPILAQAMKDHDRDMAAFYNRMADLLQL